MHFKLILIFCQDTHTESLMQAAREAGATGATVITNARGEGVHVSKTFFGLSLETPRDVILLLVEEHLSREILEHIAEVGEFESQPGAGVALQIDVEDTVGLREQVHILSRTVGDML